MTALVQQAEQTISDRRPRGRLLIAVSAVLLAILAVLSLGIGATGVSFEALPRALRASLGIATDAASLRERLVLIDIRLPRTLIGIFVGAALSVAGAILQGLFRNPLADPGLVGVSSGAALAAFATIALGKSLATGWIHLFGPYALPLAAFCGGLTVTSILVAVSARRGHLAVGTLLLAGIALGALAQALTGLISYSSDDRELRDLTLWMLGSLSGASWTKVAAVLPFALAVLVALPSLIRALNGLLLGEAEAFHLGVNVERAKKLAIAVTAAAVGAAVAVAGIIGFIGIIVPHLVRLIAGPDHRIVLPGSALLGAALMIAADIVARMAVRPAELPIGIVMAIIGAPVFLHLVLKRGPAGE